MCCYWLFCWKNSQRGNAVAIGNSAGLSLQSMNSIAIGSSAGELEQKTCSVAIGKNAGKTNQGEYSVAIGSQAGETNQGSYSVAIGYSTSALSNSIVLNGSNTALASTVSNSTTIRPIREINGTTIPVVPATQNILVYDTSTCEVKSCRDLVTSGNIQALSYKSSSDRRLKTNIEPFPSVLDRVLKTQPVTFDWKLNNRPDYGFIAQEFFRNFDCFKEAHDYHYDDTPDQYYSIDYAKITPILFKSIQELNTKIDNLEKKIYESI